MIFWNVVKGCVIGGIVGAGIGYVIPDSECVEPVNSQDIFFIPPNTHPKLVAMGLNEARKLGRLRCAESPNPIYVIGCMCVGVVLGGLVGAIYDKPNTTVNHLVSQRNH